MEASFLHKVMYSPSCLVDRHIVSMRERREVLDVGMLGRSCCPVFHYIFILIPTQQLILGVGS